MPRHSLRPRRTEAPISLRPTRRGCEDKMAPSTRSTVSEPPAIMADDTELLEPESLDGHRSPEFTTLYPRIAITDRTGQPCRINFECSISRGFFKVCNARPADGVMLDLALTDRGARRLDMLPSKLHQCHCVLAWCGLGHAVCKTGQPSPRHSLCVCGMLTRNRPVLDAYLIGSDHGGHSVRSTTDNRLDSAYTKAG